MSAFGVRDLLDVAGVPDTAGTAKVNDTGASASTASARTADAAPAPVLKGPALTPLVLSGCVRGFEPLLLLGLGFGAHRLAFAAAAPLTWAHSAAVVASVGLAAGAFHVAGCYRIGAFLGITKTAAKLAIGWTMAVLIVAITMVFAKVADHDTRVWLAGFYAGGFGLLAIERIALFAYTSAQMRKGVFDRRTAIVGGGEAAEDLIRSLEASPDSGVRIVGVFDDRGDIRSNDIVAGHPKLGNVSDLVAFARRERVDLIVFTIPISAETRILQMLAKLWVLPIDIRLSAHATKLRLRPRAYSYLGAVPVLDVFDKPLADWDIVLKNVFDKVVAILAVIALAPVMLAVAVAVKLGSKGPVLFKQKRHGFNNEQIEVYKFRSMYVEQADLVCATQVTKGDPRVTRVGRFIRKTSLDELPQFFNVLKGDLSLVGPRPHAPQSKAANTLFDQVVDGYFARHKVKPGITGWAQINGWRGETDTSEKLQRRVEHDLHYIENWSILFDLRILATTPFALLKAENAY